MKLYEINSKKEYNFSCIYLWTNLVNGKKYVGQAQSFYNRMGQYKYGNFNTHLKHAVDKYGIDNFDITPVEKTVEFLLSGAVDYEFRTTVVKNFHTTEDIVAICEWIKGARRYFLQNFVDSGNLIGKNMQGVPPEEMQKMCKAAQKIIPNTSLRGI